MLNDVRMYPHLTICGSISSDEIIFINRKVNAHAHSNLHDIK